MKRIFILLLMLFGMIGFVNAIDYDNITFTNEEFYNGAVTATKTIELSNGKLAVSYVKSSDSNSYLKICDLDGTNCGSETQIINAMTSAGLDMFEDTTNNRIIAVTGRTSSSRFVSFNLTGGDKQTHLVFDTGNTNYVSAVQTNSTDFAIAYQDSADTSDASIRICKLDGSNCGTETDMDTGINSNNKIIKNSNSKITYAMVSSGGILYIREASLTGSPLGSWQSINTGGTSSIDMIEGSDNKLKIVYRDDGSTNDGTFRTCDLDGTNCGSEIVYHSGVATYNNLQEINDKLFVQYQKETTGEGLSLNFNLTGGDISATSSFTANSTSYISSVYTSNNQLVISYNDNTASKGMFAISESLSPGATITFNNPTQGQYLNSTNIPLNVTFSTITNSTYILNAGNETTLCTNCNESSNVTLTGVEGLNNLTILTNTSGQLTNSSISFTINPYQTFYFNDDLRSINVTSFSLNGQPYTNYAQIRYNNFTEGENTLSFIANGYEDKNITFNISLQSPLNQTFNVTPSNLNLNVFDYSDLSAISNWNITIYKNDLSILTAQTNNSYQLLFNDTYQGLLKLKFHKSGYNPSYFWVNFQTGSSINENIYLINSNFDTLMPITIKDILGSKYITNASVSLYGVKEDIDYFISEEYTDDAGKVYFNLNSSDFYKVIVSKNGYLTTDYKISPLETSYTFLIPEDSTNYEFLYDGFSYKVDLFESNNLTYLRARYNDEEDLINKVTLTGVSSNWTSSNFSISSTTDTILIELPSNYSIYNYFETTLEVLRNSQTSIFYNYFSLNDTYLNNSLSQSASTQLDQDTQSTQSNKNLIVLVLVTFFTILGYVLFGLPGALMGASIISIILWYQNIMSIYLMVPVVLFCLLMLGFYRGGEY